MDEQKDYYYYPCCNEDGWREPQETKGEYRPDLDKELIGIKVDGLLNDMHNADLIYISNGCQGSYIVQKVTKRCKKNKYYDQYTIIKYIMDEVYQSHRDYWHEKRNK